MRRRQFTDDELLATAPVLLSRSRSTAVIADELGVSQAALFKRCKTKQALMLRALAPVQRPEWIDKIQAGPDDRPVPQQLREALGGIDPFFQHLLPAITVLHSTGIDPKLMLRELQEPPPVLAHRTLTAWFRRLHEHGRANIPHPQSAAKRWGEERERQLIAHYTSTDLDDASRPDISKKEVPTLAAFLPRYMEGHCKANRLRPASIRSREQVFRDHLLPAMGHKRLDRITGEDIQRFKAEREQLEHTTINLALTYLGLRVGEMIGLRWSDIDLDQGLLTVSRSIHRGEEGPPKGGRPRTTPLAPHLAEASGSTGTCD